MNRIKFLDGFRGLAILMVILYHAYTRWPAMVPYGSQFADFPLFEKGWLGVQLFFLISGFVILMTLEKCYSFKEFIIKRWLRLFPAMLIATVLIYATARFLPERPGGIPPLKDVIPGLLFMEPAWINKIFHNNQGYLEGVFWSLYVEVKYYFIFGLLYFFWGRIKAIVSIFLIFIGGMIIKILVEEMGFKALVPVNVLTHQISFIYFGWFACGSLMYIYYKEHQKSFLGYALATGVISSVSSLFLTFGRTPAVFLWAIMILVIFMATIYSDKLKALFDNKVLVYMGFVSYPLYLIHESAMIAMIIKLNRYFPSIPGLLLPVLPIAFLIGVSHLIAKYGEPPIHNFLKRVVKLPAHKPTAS